MLHVASEGGRAGLFPPCILPRITVRDNKRVLRVAWVTALAAVISYVQCSCTSMLYVIGVLALPGDRGRIFRPRIIKNANIFIFEGNPRRADPTRIFPFCSSPASHLAQLCAFDVAHCDIANLSLQPDAFLGVDALRGQAAVRASLGACSSSVPLDARSAALDAEEARRHGRGGDPSGGHRIPSANGGAERRRGGSAALAAAYHALPAGSPLLFVSAKVDE